MKRPRGAIEVDFFAELEPAPSKRRKGREGQDDHPSRRRPKGADPEPGELRGTKYWCTVDVFGQRYEVWVDQVYDPKKPDGSCVWADNRIDLLEQAVDRMHDALVHEIAHAWQEAGGAKWTIAHLFPKLSLKERRMLDELFCRFEAPALLTIFRNAGWMSLPAWPPRPARLRRTSRHPRGK